MYFPNFSSFNCKIESVNILNNNEIIAAVSTSGNFKYWVMQLIKSDFLLMCFQQL